MTLGLRFLYKLRTNTSYKDTLKLLADSEDKNYKENERSIKIMGVYIRKLKQIYMEEQKMMKKMNQTIPNPQGW